MNEYEATRAAQIAANKALIASLGLAAKSSPAKPPKRPASVSSSDEAKPTRKRTKVAKVPLEPTRRSSRLVEGASRHIALPDDFSDSEVNSGLRSRRRPDGAVENVKRIKQLPAPIFPEADEDEELNYDPDFRAPHPTRDQGNSGYGRLRFEDTPHFTPNLTPEEMMRMGSFGGTYFRRSYSSVCRKELPADFDEFPKEWYEGLDTEKYLCSQEYDHEINRYGVKASQSIEEWEKAGWIIKQDPRGWMQWYCRFYLGRRTPDDERQIRRCLSAVGPRGRFKTSLVKKIAAAGGVEQWDNEEIAPILRQTLQHWGTIITREDMQEYLGD